MCGALEDKPAMSAFQEAGGTTRVWPSFATEPLKGQPQETARLAQARESELDLPKPGTVVPSCNLSSGKVETGE